jgi:PAS domain S-box-containing protein
MTKKAKILVVEHDSVELASTARVLRSARFDVLEASSGAECLRTAKEHRPDLLLLSMELPDLRADQVCRDLKAEPTLKATVVLLVSAQGQSSEDRADALEMGADGCIVRPLGERELVAWVRSLVRTDQANTSALAQYEVVQELRRSEDNLRREQQMLSEAQRIAHLGSWGWNILTNELSWSDEVYRIFGLKPQECGATYDTFLASVHADDRESVEEAVNRALTDSEAGYSMEHRVVHPDGSHRIVHGRGDVTFDSTGRPVRMIGTLHDITEQKVAELGLRDALAEVERLRDQLLAENVYLQEEIRLAHGFDEIVGRSEPLRGTLTRIEHVAGTDASVLLLGETGTGKELFARAIHDRSPRKDHPLVKVNCAALPSSLIESELFGHVKGAFTGALSDKVGRFELADGGTLFLDEIGELDPELQTKLLRVLQGTIWASDAM